jgi:putative spermidine/putrescine transport system substrate-binding protein
LPQTLVQTSARKRRVTRTALVALGLAGLIGLSACASDTASSSDGPREIGSNIEEITKLAKEEGKVHLIGFPENWANYGASFDAFTEKYGLEVEVSNPDSSSAEMLEIARNLQGQSTLAAVPDIGPSFGQIAKKDGLLQPYKPTVFDEIPETLKDPEGYWTSAYYGVVSIGVNANEVDVPKTWEDLKDPQYKGKIAMQDPREGAAQLAQVFAASLANGGSIDDIGPGVEFFGELAEMGQLISTSSSEQALATGEAQVILDWNFNFPGMEDEMEKAGVDLQVATPSDGVFGTFYVQPIFAGVEQPNSGALFIEWLLSDEGAAFYAESGAIPARYETLIENDALPAEAIKKLPPADIIEKITFPTPENNDAATKLLTDEWGPQVASKIG